MNQARPSSRPKMIPCISQATTMSTSFQEDLPSFARGGWRAVELWLTKLETFLEGRSVAEAKSLLEGEGLHAPAAAGQGGLLISTGRERQAHWETFRRRLETLAELEVGTLIVAADVLSGEPEAKHYGLAIDSLAEAATLAEPFQIKIALEFSKKSRFCACVETALAILGQSRASNAGICLDLFHYQTGPSKWEDLSLLEPANLAWVQICDVAGVPREIAADTDRILPGDGDFRIGAILDRLSANGYDGYLSLEVLNPEIWSIPADRVADVGFQAAARFLPENRSAAP